MESRDWRGETRNLPVFAAHWINAHRSHGPTPRRFRVKPIPHRHHAAGKRKIRRRLDRPVTAPSPEPIFAASNIHYDVATKTRAVSCGGIGAIQLLVRKLGLA